MAAEALRKPYLTPEEYLAIERRAETRSEYLDGEMFAMGGASRNHNLVAGNVFGLVWQQLRGKPCEVYGNDMRVRIPATGLYTYSGVTAVCGEPQLEDEELDTLLNPTLLIEVLSPSTEAYDRGKKLDQYCRILSLREYVLVAQDEPFVAQLVRQDDDRWLYSSTSDLHTVVHLTSIDCELPLIEVYAKVDFARQR